jgi:quercetin dioxygenase-like cupin family protein
MKKNFFTSTIAFVALIGFIIPATVLAQQATTKRTELQRHDLSIPGHEFVQARVDFDPGVSFGKHTHPGEEIIYVLEGTLEYQVEYRPSVTLTAGDVLFIPAGVIHSAKNVGNGKAKELATFIVEKGKPLVTTNSSSLIRIKSMD